MSTQAFAGLIGNASILLMLGLIYDFIYEKTFRWKKTAPFPPEFMMTGMEMRKSADER